MGLISRLIEPLLGEEKIAIHAFSASLSEYKRGAPGVTLVAITARFNLSGAEIQTLEDLNASWSQGNITRDMIHDVLLMGEDGIYDVQQVENRFVINQ